MTLGQNTKITEALAYASGTADREGAIIDMAGFEGVLILVHSAAIATGATYKIKAQQGAAAALTDAADLAGTGITIADTEDDTVHWIDVKPVERYVRLVVDKDTVNICAESAVYIQYGPQGIQTPIASTVGETHHLPAEGTA